MKKSLTSRNNLDQDKNNDQSKLSFLKRLINQDESTINKNNMSKSRINFISPSQLMCSTMYSSRLAPCDPSLLNLSLFDKSETDLSIEEQPLNQINQTVSVSGTDKLPELASYTSRGGQGYEMIDPLKYKYSEDKPFPLKLLKSSLVDMAIDYIKYDPNKLQSIEQICKTLLFKKLFVYIFWIYYCCKFQNDLLTPFLIKTLREKLKQKYIKLFILIQPLKNDLLELIPFILGKAIYLCIERHLKNGKLIINSSDSAEMEMFQIVHNELNGFQMSHSYLKKNMKKYLNKQSGIKNYIGQKEHKAKEEGVKVVEEIKRLASPKKQILSKHQSQAIILKQFSTEAQSFKKAATSLRRQSFLQSTSKEAQQFKNQLKKILMNQDRKKSQVQIVQTQNKSNNKMSQVQSDKGSSWLWFGHNAQESQMMSQTSRFNKFDTSRLSPMFTSFYSNNSFANPLQNTNITVKKHITQSDERSVPTYEHLLKTYQQDKYEDIQQQKKSNKYQLKTSNIRTLNKILGQQYIQPQKQNQEIKRRERKWVLGKTISVDGNIMTSPGLQKLVELKQAVDRLPTNFKFEKRMLNNSVPKRQIQILTSNYQDLGDSILPELRAMMKQPEQKQQIDDDQKEQSQEQIIEQKHHETPEQFQKRLLQQRYDKKMKAILKRKSERELKRQEELVKELQAKEKELQKVQMTDNIEEYKAEIQQPYLKEEDVEYFFENIFQKYADDNLKKKGNQQQGLKVQKNGEKRLTVTVKKKSNPFLKSQGIVSSHNSPGRRDTGPLRRQELKFKGNITPKDVKLNQSTLDYDYSDQDDNLTKEQIDDYIQTNDMLV